mgnify:CR=1 FL=1
MESTLKLLSQLITKESEQLSYEELCQAYQAGDHNPIYLATTFSKLYRLIITKASQYYGLDSADIASFALERLDFCMLTYKPGANFVAYFMTVLGNKFREATQALSTDKRRLTIYAASLEGLMELGADFAAPPVTGSFTDQLAAANLSDREFTYCRLALEGWTNKEIATKLGVSIMTLSNLRKGLRIKLADFCL